jgi:hypothetical protein
MMNLNNPLVEEGAYSGVSSGFTTKGAGPSFYSGSAGFLVLDLLISSKIHYRGLVTCRRSSTLTTS